eukprot:TRINITY_DN6733_c0_g1_i2.p1 TRINITY_DN6733_c0_g1~~TRINITY_DN6733_c0_g1_i2.p1  ORF type:complete len:153 (+),score=57.71 TRINITY_DN6733_c0_g1_i2:181-639(+)
MSVVLPRAPQKGEVLPEVENNPDIEKQWVVKAVKQSEVYFKMITTFPDTTKLKLTPIDDEIHFEFRAVFPDMKVDVIDENAMKSAEGKAIWGPFMMRFKDRIVDFNFLTMLRVKSNEDYSEENTIVVPKIQFYAIEVARNREGKNKNITASS